MQAENKENVPNIESTENNTPLSGHTSQITRLMVFAALMYVLHVGYLTASQIALMFSFEKVPSGSTLIAIGALAYIVFNAPRHKEFKDVLAILAGIGAVLTITAVLGSLFSGSDD